ncbi:UNVERIFIED_ORG: hypothetical protein J2791_004827 [Burkholderia contaminans]|nr:hypothetical protein [Burkholderia contaminans]
MNDFLSRGYIGGKFMTSSVLLMASERGRAEKVSWLAARLFYKLGEPLAVFHLTRRARISIPPRFLCVAAEFAGTRLQQTLWMWKQRLAHPWRAMRRLCEFPQIIGARIAAAFRSLFAADFVVSKYLPPCGTPI